MDNSQRDAFFAEAASRHMGIFMKIAYAFALPTDRDDLVQEMLLAAWQALPAYDVTRCKLSTFLYRVATNRALNWNRARRRYGHKLAALESCPHLTLNADDSKPAARLEWLYALIRQLPPLDRTMLLLHLEQLSHREIGEVVGLSENNVGVRLHRIKKWLGEQRTNDGL